MQNKEENRANKLLSHNSAKGKNKHYDRSMRIQGKHHDRGVQEYQRYKSRGARGKNKP